MNIPKFITDKGPYFLHKKYGLSKGSLNLWQNKGDDWQPSPLIQLAFERIAQLEKKRKKSVYVCCGSEFDESLGKYGCPNCNGDKTAKLKKK